MNYQPKNNFGGASRNGRGNRYKKPLQITIIIVAVLIFLRLVIPSQFDSFFTFFFSPIWRIERAVSGVDISTFTLPQNSIADVTLLEQENVELKSLLGRAPSDKFVLAAVLKVPPLSAYDSLVIDLGSDEDVKVGDRIFALATDPVIASSTLATSSPVSSTSTTEVLIPIGTISETSPASSKVVLFSSPGTKYSVEIGQDHIPATARAQGGGIFEAQLAQGADINVGDAITIPDIETLTFGTVGAIVNDPTEPYMNVLFQEPVNIYELRWILVEDAQAVGK